MRDNSYDVAVIGGGPGGSTVASLTAMEGHKVLLLDKDVFPRYQIGESLLPSTVHGICAMLGVRDEIEKAGFMLKRGGTFKWGTSPDPWTFAFAISQKMAGPTSFAYQVERMKFDTILLKNAERLGVNVRQGHRAVEVFREGDRVAGVRYLDPDGNLQEAKAKFVVDASGHTGKLHDAVGGRREYSPFFRNLALFGYFTGGRRLPKPNSGNILCVAFDSGWFWYIPLTDELTSVGAVVRRDMAAKVQGDSEAALTALIEECPMIKDYLAEAKRVTEGPYGQIRVRKDYSYDRTALWSPGMVLVGDAACFIDPVFSSGVHLATYGALLAARSINTTLSGLIDEKSCFDEFEARYRREFSLFRDFLIAFYQMNQNEESYFWQARKVTEHHGSIAEAFVELVGGVSSSDFAADVEGMINAPAVAKVMMEGAQLQLRGMLGAAAGTEPPMFKGGLVPSPDGRSWLPSA